MSKADPADLLVAMTAVLTSVEDTLRALGSAGRRPRWRCGQWWAGVS
jgi:hypothetical protein